MLAKQTPGFSGADLANLVNEGAILAARRNKKTIGMSELEEAIDRVIAGPERKSRVISDARRRSPPTTRSGHALVGAHARSITTRCTRSSIIARGMMGGYTRFLPRRGPLLHGRKSQFEDMHRLGAGRPRRRES